MLRALRTFVTMVVLVVVIVIAGVWGWHAVSKPFPSRAKAVACTPASVQAGDHITPIDVTVSVLNASDREGLAERTLADLTKHHFGAGDSGNAPKNASVGNAQIWASDPGNPAVRLVLSWLPGGRVIKKQTSNVGVTVVVGQDFTKVRGGHNSMTVKQNATICSPVID